LEERVTLQIHCGRIHGQVAPHQLLSSGVLRVPHQSATAQYVLAEVEELSDAVVGASIQSCYAVFRRVPRCQHENRNGVALDEQMSEQTRSR
jgi:hypothetical protein